MCAFNHYQYVRKGEEELVSETDPEDLGSSSGLPLTSCITWQFINLSGLQVPYL